MDKTSFYSMITGKLMSPVHQIYSGAEIWKSGSSVIQLVEKAEDGLTSMESQLWIMILNEHLSCEHVAKWVKRAVNVILAV